MEGAGVSSSSWATRGPQALLVAHDRNSFQALTELLWKGTDRGLPEEEGQVPSTPHDSLWGVGPASMAVVRGAAQGGA